MNNEGFSWKFPMRNSHCLPAYFIFCLFYPLVAIISESRYNVCKARKAASQAGKIQKRMEFGIKAGRAQKFAATYRIPLLEFNQMPYWAEFCDILHQEELYEGNPETEYRIRRLADRIGKRTAVAITNSGQLLFLYCINGEKRFDKEMYTLHWDRQRAPWRLRCGESTYAFQLPESIFRLWLGKSTDELSRKKEALHCKTEFFSNMLVYYRDLESGVPAIRMISIDRYELEQAMERLGRE